MYCILSLLIRIFEAVCRWSACVRSSFELHGLLLWLMQNLYDSIKNEPFKIPEDDGNDLTHTFFNPDREGWLLKLGEWDYMSKRLTWDSCLTLVMIALLYTYIWIRDVLSKHMLWEWDSLLTHAHSLLAHPMILTTLPYVYSSTSFPLFSWWITISSHIIITLYYHNKSAARLWTHHFNQVRCWESTSQAVTVMRGLRETAHKMDTLSIYNVL